MNNQNLESKLKKLGLSDKEAKVYLALLELGTAKVREISNKSKINRATTYVILEALKKQGAVSVFEQDKKTVFSAESPRTLLRFFQKQEQDLREKESEFKKVIPELEALFNLTVEKPKVRFFEGKEGVLAIWDDIIRSGEKTIRDIYPVEYSEIVKSLFSYEESQNFTKKRQEMGIVSKSIYASETGPKSSFLTVGERKYIPKEKFPISSDVLIYGNRVAFTTLRGKLVSIIIENTELADSMRLIFELAWSGAEKN